MRIGVDVDGVLTDLEGYLFDNAIQYFKQHNIELKNPKGYDVCGMFEVDESFNVSFWKFHVAQYFAHAARDYAAEVISKLQSEGNEIYIITARGSGKDQDTLGLDETKFVTEVWLNRNGIYPNKILFTDHGKLEVCLENNIDLMIDDMPKNLLDVSSKIKCFAYHAGYNEHISNENITRCYSWYDIYYKLHELQEANK